MSDTLYTVSGYVSSVTTILNSWFLLPKKALKMEDSVDPNASFIEKISLGISAVSLVSTFTYQYDRYVKIYVDDTDKKLSSWAEWLIFSFVIIHIIAIALTLYFLLKQEGLKDQVKNGISKYVLPIVYVFIGIWHIVEMASNEDNVSAYRILNTINNFLKLADFGPIEDPMKTQPEIYYSVNGIRVMLKNAEGATLLAEITEYNKTQSAVSG